MIYLGIFFLCFAYLRLRSRRSEDAGYVPLTTRFVYITYFLEMLAFQVSFCHFIINNNKSQLLLQPYIPSHLINLKNQLRYRLLNMWKLFCVRLLSSFLDTNDNKIALPVVHRKKLWKAKLKIMRILLFFDNTSNYTAWVNDIRKKNQVLLFGIIPSYVSSNSSNVKRKFKM